MKIISIFNNKGGTGKTTTSLNLSSYLSDQLDYRVLLVDLDAQANLSSVVGAKPSDKNALSLFTHDYSARELIQSLENFSFDIIPSTNYLANVDLFFANNFGKEYLVSDALKELEDSYDFIIIDNAPSLGLTVLNSLLASSDVVIPTQADYYAIDSLKACQSILDTIGLHAKPINVIGVLLTRYNSRTRVSQDIHKELENIIPDLLNTSLFNTEIPESTVIKEAQIAGVSPYKYAPKNKSITSYKEVAQELLERIENE